MTGEEKLTKFLNDLDMSGPYDLKCNHCGAEFHSGFSHECSYEKLKADNKRLREALEFYADFTKYEKPFIVKHRGTTLGDSDVQKSLGSITRTALEDNT